MRNDLEKICNNELTSQKKNYIVIDEFCQQEQADALLKHFYGNELKWTMTQCQTSSRYNNFLTVTNDHYHKFRRKSAKIKEGPQLNHYFFDKTENGGSKPVSDFVVPVTDLIKVICMKFNISTFKVLRIKANLKMQLNGFTEKCFNTPHKDDADNHIVLIYYVNDSDGDTILFDDKFKETARIRPKKNRLLIFNGETWHAASHPVKNQTRCVINMDLSVTPTEFKDE